MDTIESTYGYLADGETVGGQVCPLCHGGRSNEKSFRVTREGGRLKYVCFRASCGFSGRTGAAPFTGDRKQQEGNSKLPVVAYSIALNKDQTKMLSDKFGIEEGMFEFAGWRYCPDFGGLGPYYMLPIFGPDGSIRAYTYRRWDGREPKAIIRKIQPDEETICWYRSRRFGKTLVVVEDQASALRVSSQQIDALSLCGVALTLPRINEIKKQNYETVLLCLDQDASPLAIQHMVNLKARLPALRVRLLDQDIKNMPEVRFQLFVDEVDLL